MNGIGSGDFLAAKTFESEAVVTFKLLATNGLTEQTAIETFTTLPSAT